MPTEVETFIDEIREKLQTARRQADFYDQMLKEIEAAAGRRPAREKGKGTPKTKRRSPVRAEVSASEGVLRLLAGCKMGLPGSEIVQYVATTHGHRPNSLRTTLYNLKKKGDIVQDERGIYHHPTNVG